MTTTAEAPAAETTTPKGDTTLRNIRIDDELWFASGPACKRQGTDRSKVTRDALQAVVDRETDETWKALTVIATERDTTAEALQAYVVEQYVAKIHRDRETQRKRALTKRNT